MADAMMDPNTLALAQAIGGGASATPQVAAPGTLAQFFAQGAPQPSPDDFLSQILAARGHPDSAAYAQITKNGVSGLATPPPQTVSMGAGGPSSWTAPTPSLDAATLAYLRGNKGNGSYRQ